MLDVRDFRENTLFQSFFGEHNEFHWRNGEIISPSSNLHQLVIQGGFLWLHRHASPCIAARMKVYTNTSWVSGTWWIRNRKSQKDPETFLRMMEIISGEFSQCCRKFEVSELDRIMTIYPDPFRVVAARHAIRTRTARSQRRRTTSILPAWGPLVIMLTWKRWDVRGYHPFMDDL